MYQVKKFLAVSIRSAKTALPASAFPRLTRAVGMTR
ncbi:MAG: hypothetical protein A4E73_03050 [Syntrophaceae bacterium PtaU1.Bin231]|nr:MAG: hypothetical protein A4E73_03050 [Syntrophaceae bacterium PtaU1.Bin231]